MSVRTKTTLFNAALLRTGQDETYEGEGGPLWRALDANYDEIVRLCFEDGDGVFPFGKKRVTLTSRFAGTFGFDDSYTLPDGCLHVIEVFLQEKSASDLLEPWEIDGVNNAIVLNASNRTVEIEYVMEGAEYTWSAGFAKAVQKRLEAVIKDVLEETEEAMAKDQDADFLLLKGSVKSAKNRSQRPIFKRGGGRLIRARRGQYNGS